jgi:hypothetical protein
LIVVRLINKEIEPDNTFALYLPTPGWELKFKYHDFSKFWWLTISADGGFET